MKRVFVWGGWSRNVGDLAILYAQTAALQQLSLDQIQFIPINSDISLDGKIIPRLSETDINMINNLGDMLIVGAGGQIMRHPGESGWQFNISLENLRRLRVPLVVYGIGLNWFPQDPPIEPRVIEHIAEVYKVSELFSVREGITASWLVDQGLSNEHIKVIPDPAMFVPCMDLHWDKLDNYHMVVAFNWASDRRDTRGNTKQFATLVANDLAAFAEEHKAIVVYVPHVHAYDCEQFTHRLIFSSALGNRWLDLEDYPNLYPETLSMVPYVAGIYRRAEVAVGMRGHSCVIPYGMVTPSVAIGDHIKCRAFADEAGLLPPVTTNAKPGDLYKAMEAAVQSKSDKILSNLSLWQSDACNFNNNVLSLL